MNYVFSLVTGSIIHTCLSYLPEQLDILVHGPIDFFLMNSILKYYNLHVYDMPLGTSETIFKSLERQCFS